jgi:hypothetical protein
MLVHAPGSQFNLGHGFDGSGHTVTWPAPQPFDANGNLLCATYWVQVTNSALPLQDVTLRVSRRHPFSQPHGCSDVPLLSDEHYEVHCVPGGEGNVNSPRNCSVAMTPATWSEIRGLYR